MESMIKKFAASGRLAAHETIRRDCYVMLASLLMQTPSEELMDILGNLQWDEGLQDIQKHALETLRQAARDYPLASLEVEFNQLFIGLGSGEMMPYASWYREKTMQSAPLASLRSDLLKLGILRQTGCPETEDHAGALCEIMALASQQPNDIPPAVQAGFFNRHIAPWMPTFFKDLQSAKNAQFYRIVGLFGSCFLAAESKYLNRDAQIPLNDKKGGLQNENRTCRQSADIF